MSDSNLNPQDLVPIYLHSQGVDEILGIEALESDGSDVEEIVGGDAAPVRTRSKAWEHFDTVKVPGCGWVNKCKHCKKLLSGQKKGTTSHLIRHLKLACPFRHKLFPSENKESSKSKQSHLDFSSGESSVFTFSFERVKRLAAHMILAHEYPFNIVEHKVFNEFLKAYSPFYKKIGRHAVRAECFAVFNSERERIKGILSKVNRVSLTTDCWWSGVQKIGYMVVNCHFIDRNWMLQKRVISFVNVPPPHNGVALAKDVHRVSNFYAIYDKIASVTVDNASANDVCIGILKKDHNLRENLVLDGKLFHVRCCAHIINLLVKDGLKEIENVVDVVREGVKYLFGSENRLTAFNEHRITLQLPPNRLVLDNNTRWNSTYVMLSTAYKYRQCFDKSGVDDPTFEKYCPTSIEWAEVNEVCEFLEVFLDVTNLISGSNYATVNLFLLELARIKELINGQLDPNGKKHMQNMASRMALKFDKYWFECDLLLSFGSILDPRYKNGMIEYAFISMYPTDYEAKIKQVENNFNALYDQYALIYGDPKGKGPAQCSSYLKQPPSTSVGKKKFDVFMLKMQSNGKVKNDVELYFEEICYPNVADFDVLVWWKANEGKYKILSKMANDVLSIPITTVASESTFSAGGRVIDKKRVQ
ncbi:hypothetical protein OROMI_026595 [Orobanche minor]